MAGRKIEVQIVGDASSLKKAFGQASGATDGFGSSLGKMAKYGALAVGAAGIGGLAVVLKQGIAEFSQAAKVGAQTNAVLQSTGGVANVTAGHVSKLAEALMRKTGVDDEAIQSGENMLLTFTKVRNQVGQGNDVFDQATKAALNLSVALGKDMPASAMLVGKALNDPIKGMTAMTKAGIQFTDSQKESIKAMVESGNTMGAQKMILKELETQFGGSAVAIGQTLPGQINILKESFNNLAGEVVQGLVPAFTQVMDWTTRNWPTIERVIKAVFTGISTVIGAFVGFIRTHWQTITTVTTTAFNTVRDVAQKVWPQVQAAAATVVAWYRTNLQPAIENVIRAVTAIWNKFGADITRIAGTAFNTAKAVIGNALRVIQGVIELVLAVIRGDWSKAWNALKMIVSNAMDGIKTLLSGMVSIVFQAGVAIGKAIIQGVIAGIGSLLDALEAKIAGVGDMIKRGVKKDLGIESPSKVFFEIGADTIRGWILGISAMEPALTGKHKDTVIAAVSAALNAAKETIGRYQGVFAEAFGKLGEYAKRAFDAKTQNLLDNVSKRFDAQIAKWQSYASAMTPAEKALAALDAAEQKRSQDSAVAAAQESMAKAQAMAEGAERDAAILSAQESMRQAQLTIQRAGLQEQAEVERAAREAEAATHIAKLEATKARELQNLEERRRQLAESLDAQLAVLAERLAKHPEEFAKIQKKIQALLASYGIPMQKAGENLGKAFARGIRNSIDEAVAAAKALAKAVAQYLPHSPAEKGPLSKPINWKGYLTAGMPGGSALAGMANGMVAGMGSSGPSMAMAGAGGGARSGGGWPERIVLQVDGRVLSEVVRTEVARTIARNK